MLVSSRHNARRTRCTRPSQARSPPSAYPSGSSRPTSIAWSASSGSPAPPGHPTAGCGPTGSASASGAHGQPSPDRPGPGVEYGRHGSAMIGGVALRVSSPVLVGRGAEAARLWAAFGRAQAGSPATVVMAGEAGVGKTRLVTELLARVRAQEALALAGGCLNVGEGVVAYAPLVEALRSLGGAVDQAELERVLGGARAELARLVPELGGPVEAGVQAAPGAGALTPGRLFELLLGVLHRLA